MRTTATTGTRRRERGLLHVVAGTCVPGHLDGVAAALRVWRTRSRHEPFVAPGAALLDRYNFLRRGTTILVDGLPANDGKAGAASTTRAVVSHLARTTRAVEARLLIPHLPGYRPFAQEHGAGRAVHANTLASVFAYRRHVDDAIGVLLRGATDVARLLPDFEAMYSLEEVHQERLLTDLVRVFHHHGGTCAVDARWPDQDALGTGELCELPHAGLSATVSVASRLVTNAEWQAFIADGGYVRQELWSAAGWHWRLGASVRCPLYWRENGDGWQQFGLAGWRHVHPDGPVMHVSHFEACAFASWAGARLPDGAEWERAALAGLLEQQDDVAWQWTSDQHVDAGIPDHHGRERGFVLRGGSAVTPVGHAQLTSQRIHRAGDRRMFCGVRLARTGSGDPDVVTTRFASEVLAGLRRTPKALPRSALRDGSPMMDDAGSSVAPVDARDDAELALLRATTSHIVSDVQGAAVLYDRVEGDSAAVWTLLEAMPTLAGYVPLAHTRHAALMQAARIEGRFPHLSTRLIGEQGAPDMEGPDGTVPGLAWVGAAAMGACDDAEVARLLERLHDLLGSRGVVLAAFVLPPVGSRPHGHSDTGGNADNARRVLQRVNAQLGGGVDVGTFDVQSRPGPTPGSVETWIVSRVAQELFVGGVPVRLAVGEEIAAGRVFNRAADDIRRLAQSTRWRIQRQWISTTTGLGLVSLRPSHDHPF